MFSSRSVRLQWGHLVRTGVVKRDFRQISLNNIITLGTRIRIIILKVQLCVSFSTYCDRPVDIYLAPEPADSLLYLSDYCS
jgi:hypothetical protein